jgi:hypothetical protein
MSKDIKIGHDKRPAPLIQQERPLFNIRTGKPLTDEGGVQLVSQEDTFLTTESSSQKATPVTFTNQKTNFISERVTIKGDSFQVNNNIVTGVGSEFLSVLTKGDVLLLPTANSGTDYEQRTIDLVNSNTQITLLQSVSTNRTFTRLYKKNETRQTTVWKVEEQFAEFSEVSTSLLGYPKAEAQLSLFSNVSSYGLDADEFLWYQASQSTNSPYIWETRKNRTYGNHYRHNLREVKQESALALEVFPTAYTYPFGPEFETEGLYNETQYLRFNNFMKLGTILYDHYSNPANNNGNNVYKNEFLPYIKNHYTLTNVTGSFEKDEVIEGTSTGISTATVIEWKPGQKVLHFDKAINLTIGETITGIESGATAVVQSVLNYNSVESFYDNFINPLNPYYKSIESFMAQLDTWTETWRDLSRGLFNSPAGVPIVQEFINNLPAVQQIFGGQSIFPNQTVPGYSTAFQSNIFLQSRKAFRYQPGRISGYTFGTRASGDAADNNVVIEWGIGNPTDDLKFQIRGGSFNIVRRSVVPLSTEVLLSNGLSESDQVNIGTEEEPMWETIFSRDKWNGDTLDGNGPSRYDWKADRVTMYKIEFGWYGAIGVQFYAFVPVKNDDARWVKLHRIIIENSLTRPCMGDPFYFFKYSIQVFNNLNLKTPQFIYKYGTSCYIDGGDEGSVTVYSASSDVKQVSGSGYNTLLAVNPKTTITNSLGVELKNKKSIFPKKIALSSSGLTEVKVVKCKGCPGGFGQVYTPNLRSSQNGKNRLVSFVPTGATTFDRSQIELPILNRTVVNTNGTDELTLNSVSNINVGDYIVPKFDINGTNYFQEDTVVERVIQNENKIILTKNLANDFTDTTAIEIQPLFTISDFSSKIIAPGIWNTYVGDSANKLLNPVGSGQILGYTTARLEGWDPTTLTVDTQSKSFRTSPLISEYGGQLVTMPTQFTARFSAYNSLAASQIPVTGRVNKLRFVFPNINESFGQLAEWRVGVTYLKPEETVDGIRWRDKNGQITQLTESAKLVLEQNPFGTDRSFRGFESGETYYGAIIPFTIDYRADSPPGTYGGICADCELNISEALPISCEQILGSQIPSEQVGEDHDNAAYYLRVQGTFGFTFNPEGGEIGFNVVDQLIPPQNGSNIFFDSDVKTYQDEVTVDGATSVATFEYVKITSNLVAQTAPIEEVTIFYVPIEFISYRKKSTKALNYNPYPLYFFVEMRDNSALNNLVIEEQTQYKNTYNPLWITTEGMNILTTNIETGVVGSTEITTGGITQAPPNYEANDRLSSAEIDSQNESILRPYEVVDTFYVSDETKQIDLTNIFGFEKEVITPDLLNTEAIFFIAKSKELDDTFVQATLTYTEQQ